MGTTSSTFSACKTQRNNDSLLYDQQTQHSNQQHRNTPNQYHYESFSSRPAAYSSDASITPEQTRPETVTGIWAPDSTVPSCASCHNQFWLFLRRHHCRICGDVFCAACSNNRIRVPVLDRRAGTASTKLVWLDTMKCLQPYYSSIFSLCSRSIVHATFVQTIQWILSTQILIQGDTSKAVCWQWTNFCVYSGKSVQTHNQMQRNQKKKYSHNNNNASKKQQYNYMSTHCARRSHAIQHIITSHIQNS